MMSLRLALALALTVAVCFGQLGTARAALPVDEADSGRLRSLIVGMIDTHGAKYARGPEHLAQLDKLADDDSDALAELQRHVLLADVDKLVVIRRQLTVSAT